MNKKRTAFLAKLHHAREVLKTSDPGDVALVKSVYDHMLHRFGDPDFIDATDGEEFVQQWNKCRDSVRDNLVENELITTGTFITLWNAYDVITTEQAMAFA